MCKKLTVLIPCKNECHNIRPCIESVSAIADEILIADSGSTDGTVEAAISSDKCRVIQREWNGYAAFKNWAISQAEHSWVLIVDADERVTPDLADEIRQILKDPPSSIDAYRIRHRNFFLGHELRFSGRNTTSTCRLIRRDACRYKKVRVHEEIEIDPARVRRLSSRFIHYEFRSYDHYFAKRLKYTKLASEDRWENKKRAGLFNLFFRPFLRFFQLYCIRGGFLDGLPGLQNCMLMAFFNTFVKQARLWEMQYSIPQEVVERANGTLPDEPANKVPPTESSQKLKSYSDFRSREKSLSRL